METNTCKKCGLTKPVEDFVKDKKLSRGIENRCKQCKRILGAAYYKKISKIPERMETLRLRKRAILRKWRENLPDDRRERFRVNGLETNSKQRWAEPKIARILNLCNIVLKEGDECLVVLVDGNTYCRSYATDKRWWPGKTLRAVWGANRTKANAKGVGVFKVVKLLGGELATREMMTCPSLYQWIRYRADFLIEAKRRNKWPEYLVKDRRRKNETTQKSENK